MNNNQYSVKQILDACTTLLSYVDINSISSVVMYANLLKENMANLEKAFDATPNDDILISSLKSEVDKAALALEYQLNTKFADIHKTYVLRTELLGKADKIIATIREGKDKIAESNVLMRLLGYFKLASTLKKDCSRVILEVDEDEIKYISMVMEDVDFIIKEYSLEV